MTEEDHILIENYLRGLLSENENKTFLERLESDEEFKECFEFEQQAFSVLNDDEWSFVSQRSSEVKAYKSLLEESDMQDLKKTLNKVKSNYKGASRDSNKTFFYYLAAASILVFLGFQFFLNQSPTNQDLYAKYVNINDLPSFATRGGGDVIAQKLVKAQQLFENENYQESLELFESILKFETANISLYLYTGIAQTELKLYDKASTTFDDLINNNSIDGSIGHWYKALLFLKQDKIDEAKIILKHIVRELLYNHTKAKDLLNEL
ncbi:hypothetical protein [uncultured Psychroserpens sp.]|uniref:tetratricopeptide repeat protein n=1 Tax=uncultured Psychroserpens sp. TaxID=255436 RepID=UPI0026130AF5|nr:hypothetical protein [uncultured Psychroserpens sp.]